MDYKEKYIKYKIQYLELQNQIDKNYMIGGASKNDKMLEFDNIVNFIKNSNKKTIVKKLFDLIYDTTYCPIILGQGTAGKVYLPEINKTFPYKIGNKIIQLPIVVKVAVEQNNIKS
jgi:hypothetical protein